MLAMRHGINSIWGSVRSTWDAVESEMLTATATATAVGRLSPLFEIPLYETFFSQILESQILDSKK